MRHPERAKDSQKQSGCRPKAASGRQEGARRLPEGIWETLETHRGDHLEHPVTLYRAWEASNIQENAGK